MANLTTGLIDNTPVNGVRPTSRLQIRFSNDDLVNPGSVQLTGVRLIGNTVKDVYALATFAIPANSADIRNYTADFDAFEFSFITTGGIIEISAWGKDAAGNLVAAHRVLAEEEAII